MVETTSVMASHGSQGGTMTETTKMTGMTGTKLDTSAAISTQGKLMLAYAMFLVELKYP